MAEDLDRDRVGPSPDPWAGGWKVETVWGSAAQLHARSAEDVAGPAPPARTARLLIATQPAVVLGSGQPAGTVDPRTAAAMGYQVARRRSGGGAVLVGSGHCLWVDLLVPAGDRLWDGDVARAAWWVGDLWALALASVGVWPLSVWKAPLRRTEWSGLVCFAGVGAGEVLVGSGPGGGRKVFGVSQRRTRFAALFQTATLIEWHPADLARLLRVKDPGPIEGVAVGVGSERAEQVWDAVVERLGP